MLTLNKCSKVDRTELQTHKKEKPHCLMKLQSLTHYKSNHKVINVNGSTKQYYLGQCCIC